MTQIKSWFAENHTMVYFMVAQAIAVGGGAAYILAYAVKLEQRVHTMETRGAEYTIDRMNQFDRRITTLDEQQKSNKHSIDRIIDVMTRELGRPVPMLPRP